MTSYYQTGYFFEKPVIMCGTSGQVKLDSTAEVIINEVDFRGCLKMRIISVGVFKILSSVLSGDKSPSSQNGCFGTALTAINSVLSILNTTFKRFKGYPKSELHAPGAIKCILCDMKVHASTFMGNEGVYGGAIYAIKSTIYLRNSTFVDNGRGLMERHGGVIFANQTNLTVINCEFFSNGRTHIIKGGVLKCIHSKVEVRSSLFIGNTAKKGAVLFTLYSNVTISKSKFNENVGSTGGVVFMANSFVRISRSTFDSNEAAHLGAALYSQNTTAYVESNSFKYNTAHIGGGLCIWENSILYMNGTNTFSNNSAIRYGSAIYVYYATMKGYGTVLVKNGYALSESVAFISSHGHFSGKFVLLNNIGSLFVFDSNLKITRNITISNNIPSSKGFETSIPEGGGITAFMSTITLKGVANIQQNCAANGGGILASTSKLKLWGHFSFLRNSASDTGGTMYLQQSELNIKGYALLTENTANKKGGAIHAIGSSLSLILVRKSPLYASKLHIRANTADRGGGIYFEWNSKIYVMSRQEQNVYFENNVADFGSAIYVNDSTSIGTCATIQNRCAIEASQSRCFFQKGTPSQLTIIHKVFNFTNNVARKSGRVLYGGLLDRCTVTVNRYMYGTMDIKYAEQEGAFDYIRGYSTSNPVRICFCRSNDVVDCSYTPPNVKVMLGYTFSLSLVAVDQMNRTTNANVCAYLNNTTHRLGENQREQVTTTTCSSLTYNVYSFENISHGMLYFYAVGPCRNLGISMQSVTIDFLPCKCPIGFAIDSFNRDKCYCNCDPTLKPYITKCNFSTQSVIRDGDFWIDTSTSFNETQFVVYPHCPLDYCLPASSKIQLNLSSPNAADAQCAFGRVGKLCGICKRGFTLSLGSSQCLECPEYWPVLTVVIALSFIIGGILLATMILACNLTVATGSINALIFYANVIYANKSIFMPFRQPNLHTTFIHWMNLNFGLDACFIKGMDSYLKTWLNLAFPIYILFIIFTIILLSKISTRFAAIIGRKNPVATLATLLLLCYTNLLQVIITAVSYAVLDYHDHVEIVWLEDATIEYISVKHIPLLIIVCLIWIFGLAYTILLTFWQCLTKLSERKGFKWVKNTKLILFMETYHAPYRSKNRYWTGLLLFVRVSLYASAAANSSKVPKINLMLTIILTAFLLTLATTQIYKKFWLNILEVVVYFNIIVFSVAMFYLEDTGREKDKTAVCYSSVTISFIIFIAILVYHLKMVCSQAYRHVLHNFFAIRSMRLNPQIACRDQSVTHSIVGISRSSSYGGKS